MEEESRVHQPDEREDGQTEQTRGRRTVSNSGVKTEELRGKTLRSHLGTGG